ncbi:hypothetical protein CYY_000445 [Polysphondylium violaceum]|uniref:Succinate dehydrogenase cytochrome b560 subunit, mitochondrial n=1 Tax=Polysphondylium violaceum TaxID=133409 RepID=A0A8J4V2F1_9MYCE|nr:hypothetical protein CYY_000445 [Polysphondylium violaceum]
MFGRSLYVLTTRSVTKSAIPMGRQGTFLALNNLNTISNSSNNKLAMVNNYSTQAPKFTMTEKKIEEVVTPKRATSPHLTIYKFPMPAVMSIFHRATGIALGLGVAAVCGISLFAPHDPTYYIELFKTQYPFLVIPAKFIVSYPILYHFSTGVRHLVWDETCKGITTKQVEKTGMMILAITGAVAVVLSFMN